MTSQYQQKNIIFFSTTRFVGNDFPLPPDLLKICLSYVVIVKQKKHNNGQLREEETFLNGKKHGSFRCWYDNNQLFEENFYYNNKQCRTSREWYPDGQLCHEYMYNDGEPTGICKSWHENGQLSAICNWDNNEVKEWNDNGVRIY